MFAFEAVNPAWITRRKTFTDQRQEQETEQPNPTRGIEARGQSGKRSAFVPPQYTLISIWLADR